MSHGAVQLVPGRGVGFVQRLLGSWFIIGNLLAVWGERRDRAAKQWVSIPVITPVIYVISIVAFLMGVALWLSLWDLVVPLGHAMFVMGLIVLLAFAAVELADGRNANTTVGIQGQGLPDYACTTGVWGDI